MYSVKFCLMPVIRFHSINKDPCMVHRNIGQYSMPQVGNVSLLTEGTDHLPRFFLNNIPGSEQPGGVEIALQGYPATGQGSCLRGIDTPVETNSRRARLAQLSKRKPCTFRKNNYRGQGTKGFHHPDQVFQ